MNLQLLKPAIGSAIFVMLLSSMSVQAGDVGVGARVGLLGLGGELTYRATDYFGLRLQLHSYSHSEEFDEDDIDYSGEIELSTYGALVDWHPFGGNLRLSAGAYNNGNELGGVASGAGDYDIGDETFTSVPTDPVSLNLSAKLGDGFAPYVGFGWGNSPRKESGLILSLDLGALLSGPPDISLSASGTAIEQSTLTVVNMATDPIVQTELNKEIAALEDDISDFELYPVIMLGIGWRF